MRYKQTGDAGDTVLRETGEKTNVRPFLYGCQHYRWHKNKEQKQGQKLLHIVRRGRFCSEQRSECRFGGADAGYTAANVNLIQPREKRKAFNTMKHALARTYPYCHTRLGPALDPTARPIMYHRRKLQQNVNSECEGRRFNVLAQAYFTTATE